MFPSLRLACAANMRHPRLWNASIPEAIASEQLRLALDEHSIGHPDTEFERSRPIISRMASASAKHPRSSPP